MALVIGVLAALWSASGYIGAFMRAVESDLRRRRGPPLLQAAAAPAADDARDDDRGRGDPDPAGRHRPAGDGDRQRDRSRRRGADDLVDRQVAAAVRGGGRGDRAAVPFSPDARHEGMRWILPGALVATVLWMVALGRVQLSTSPTSARTRPRTAASPAASSSCCGSTSRTSRSSSGRSSRPSLERTRSAVREPAPPGETVAIDPAERDEGAHYSPTAAPRLNASPPGDRARQDRVERATTCPEMSVHERISPSGPPST